MSAVAERLEVPSDLRDLIVRNVGAGASQRWLSEVTVLQAVRDGWLTLGEAADHLGMGYFEAEAFLHEKGVAYRPTDEEFARDQAEGAAHARSLRA